MLKWFGAGVGCTTAVALGLYALNVKNDAPHIPAAGSFALPLESEDPAPSSRSTELTKTTIALVQNVQSSAIRARGQHEIASLRITNPERQVTEKPALSRGVVSNDAGWTLRFVPSSTEKLTTVTRQTADQNERTALAKRIQSELARAGWSTRTSATPPRQNISPRLITSNTVTPSSGRAAFGTSVQPPRPSLQQRNSNTSSGRMALGARPYPPSGEPATGQQVAPLAVSPNNSFGPTDLNRRDNFVAPRYDAERSEALQREAREAKRRAR